MLRWCATCITSENILRLEGALAKDTSCFRCSTFITVYNGYMYMNEGTTWPLVHCFHDHVHYLLHYYLGNWSCCSTVEAYCVILCAHPHLKEAGKTYSNGRKREWGEAHEAEMDAPKSIIPRTKRSNTKYNHRVKQCQTYWNKSSPVSCISNRLI